MKKLLSLSVLSAGLVLAVSSCKKDDPPPGGPYFPTQAKTALAGLQDTLQTFTVTAGNDTTIVGAKGTKLRFYASSFRNDSSGAVITSGAVSIRLREVYSAGDRIRNGAPTTLVSGNILTSGGSVQVMAMQNGKNLRANQYGLFFKQPAASTQSMQLFTGVDDAGGFGMDWAPVAAGTGTFAGETRKDSGINNFFYVFDSVNSFNWINCDYFYSSALPRTTVSINVPDVLSTPTNSVAFLVFPTISSVARSYSYDAGTRTYSFSQNYAVPTGMPVKIAVLSKRGSNYYFKATALQNVTEDMRVTITPEGIAEYALIAELAAL